MSGNPSGNNGNDGWKEERVTPSAVTWGGMVWFILILGITGAVLASLMMPAVVTPRHVALRTMCRNNLKLIGLALHNYHDEYGVFPPAYSVDENGVRLHSWRTLILPLADGSARFFSSDLSEPSRRGMMTIAGGEELREW